MKPACTATATFISVNFSSTVILSFMQGLRYYIAQFQLFQWIQSSFLCELTLFEAFQKANSTLILSQVMQ